MAASLPEVECLRVQSFVASFKKALPSREEPDISLSIVDSKARLHLLYTRAPYARNISPKHGSALNTHRMVLYVGILNGILYYLMS